MAWVFLEIPRDLHLEGDITAVVDKGIGQGEEFLHALVVREPLNRVNTGDNTLAVCFIEFMGRDAWAITVAPRVSGART
jgi:fumarate hydratase subunit alpha